MADLLSTERLQMIACYQNLFDHLRAIQSNVNNITDNQTYISDTGMNNRWSELHEKINLALREVVIAKSLLLIDDIEINLRNQARRRRARREREMNREILD